MPDVTGLIDAAAAGDRRAAADLLPLVYDELRKLAAAKMAAEPAGNTLDATALVHEAFLRLIGPADVARWDHRGHFFAAAAEAMRRILVDAARRKAAQRHGGGRTRLPLDESLLADRPAADLLAVDEALDGLAAEDPTVAELVKLHVFVGLTVEEAGAALGVSPRTAYRDWQYARAWLVRRLGGNGDGPR
jgi:RNA polymerase sigma factor (TIGR02999 family)